MNLLMFHEAVAVFWLFWNFCIQNSQNHIDF
jgi:hypothetical protein